MSRLCDLEVTLHHETEKAVLVSLDGDKNKAVWLPYSAIEIVKTPRKNVYLVTLPQQLALEKGLI